MFCSTAPTDPVLRISGLKNDLEIYIKDCMNCTEECSKTVNILITYTCQILKHYFSGAYLPLSK